MTYAKVPRKYVKKSRYDVAQDRKIRQLQRKVARDEVKAFDDYGTAAALTTISPLAPIGQGDSEKERVGLTINAKHIAFNYYLNMNASATANPTMVRVCLVRDNESDGTYPTYLNVFPDGKVQSFKNMSTMKGRFTILYDRIHQINISGTGIPVANIGMGRFKKSWKVGKRIRFDGAGATDTHNGQVFLVAFSDELVNPPTITWESRVLYTDS